MSNRKQIHRTVSWEPESPPTYVIEKQTGSAPWVVRMYHGAVISYHYTHEAAEVLAGILNDAEATKVRANQVTGAYLADHNANAALLSQVARLRDGLKEAEEALHAECNRCAGIPFVDTVQVLARTQALLAETEGGES